MPRAVLIPDATHPVSVRPTAKHVTVRIAGVTIAETDSALSLAEATYPVVQYVPLADVDQSLLERTTTQTYCPYKGDASYYSVRTPDGHTEPDVIWSYEHPYPAVADIAGHVAFYRDRAEITIGLAGPGPARLPPSQHGPAPDNSNKRGAPDDRAPDSWVPADAPPDPAALDDRGEGALQPGGEGG